MGDAIFAFDYCVALFKGRLGVALADLEVVGDVGSRLGEDKGHDLIFGHFGVNKGCVVLGALFWVKNALEQLVFNLDQFKGFFSGFFIGGDHAGDRIADVAHTVAAKDVTILQIQADKSWVILAGDDGADARQLLGLAGVDGYDARVGMRAALDASK